MTGDLISALFLFIGNVGHMGVLSYKVLKFTELEDDYLNPTDFAKTMNSLVPYELIVQGVLVFVVLLNWIFSFSSLKLFVLIIMGTHLAVQGIRFADKKIVDASRIWDRTHKNEVQRQIIIGLVFAGVAFFCLLYNLVAALTHVKR